MSSTQSGGSASFADPANLGPLPTLGQAAELRRVFTRLSERVLESADVVGTFQDDDVVLAQCSRPEERIAGSHGKANGNAVVLPRAFTDRAVLSHELRRTIHISAAIGLATALVFGVGGRVRLYMFGPRDADATAPLAILGATTLTGPSHYIAVCRVNGDLGRCALISSVGSAVELGLVLVASTAHGDLIEVAVAWVLGMTVQVVILCPAVAAVRGRLGACPIGSTS